MVFDKRNTIIIILTSLILLSSCFTTAFHIGTSANENFYTHKRIERLALKEANSEFFTDSIIKAIYFGNHLRDMSQLNDGLLKEYFGEETILDFVKWQSQEEFPPKDGFIINRQLLGTYSAREHFDSPSHSSSSNPLLVKHKLDTNWTTLQKFYLKDSINYINEMILKSVESYRMAASTCFNEQNCTFKHTMDAFRYFGSALHTVEDFYAHSNFVELSLLQTGHKNVFPFVTGKKEGLKCKESILCYYPLLTGYYDSKSSLDSLIAILDQVEKHLLPKTTNKQTKSSLLNPTSTFLSSFEKSLFQSDDISTTTTTTTNSIISNQIFKLVQNLKQNTLEKLSNKTNLNNNNNNAINFKDDPSHSQLSKDNPLHPLHKISSKCAINTIKHISKQMVHCWNNGNRNNNIDTLLNSINDILQHPSLIISSTKQKLQFQAAGKLEGTTTTSITNTGYENVFHIGKWGRDNPDLISKLDLYHVSNGMVDIRTSTIQSRHRRHNEL